MLDPEGKGYTVEVREVGGCSECAGEDQNYNDCPFLERRFWFVCPSHGSQAPWCSANNPGSITAPSPLMQG